MADSGSDNSDSEYENNVEDDSDAELQEAFAKGQLKPGLNVACEPKKEYKNNVAALKLRLTDMQQGLDWVERLDLTTGLAPMAPEMAVHLAEKKEMDEKKQTGFTKSLDSTLDDFQREINFHRQAQACVMEGLARLKKFGIATKRPEDYFAEMAKSDTHMQKVRDSLLKKKAGIELSEKVRKARQNRKMMKQLQVQAQLQRQKDKKELMNEVKKYRKGIRKDLDFLEPGGGKPKQQNKKNSPKSNKKTMERRKFKDSKYGYGGKKRGSKTNTKESSSNVGGHRPPRPANGKKKQGNRPGKNRRVQMKGKRKK